jgi:hypothetical protein
MDTSGARVSVWERIEQEEEELGPGFRRGVFISSRDEPRHELE